MRHNYKLLQQIIANTNIEKVVKIEWLEKIFNRTYQHVDNVADAFKMKQQK